MDACDKCGDPAEYDVLADGNYLRLCRHCISDDMVIMEKPSKAQIDYSYKRPSVKQILSGMAGIPRNSIERLPNPAPTMSMLRTSVKESEIKKRLTNMKISSPDQSRVVHEREPSLPSPVTLTKEKKDLIDSEDDFLDI
jgi:hypothetical protein